MTVTNGDPVTEWIDRHPWTSTYVAIVVTLLLIIQVIELFSQ